MSEREQGLTINHPSRRRRVQEEHVKQKVKVDGTKV